MADSAASYLHMVQHLIEMCLVFHMNIEESMEALDKHAGIPPVITSTVWNELEKENKELFQAHHESLNKEAEITAMMQRMKLSDGAE